MDSQRLILVVDDSAEQFEAVMRAFRKAGIDNPVHRCADGDDVIEYLQRSAAPGGRTPRPAVVLLDLNMPGLDGREVLEQIKADERFCDIPVVVLTTSSNPNDIRHCYRVGASGYIIKPIRFDDFLGTVERFRDYWLETVALPTH